MSIEAQPTKQSAWYADSFSSPSANPTETVNPQPEELKINETEFAPKAIKKCICCREVQKADGTSELIRTGLNF